MNFKCPFFVALAWIPLAYLYGYTAGKLKALTQRRK